MAPPTRHRPHLNDLLQKNLELEHVVADLRHQLTQSSAKWADERKMLAVGCDTLMASFAKFRARLDVQPLDWADSEGEVEQNLDVGRQSSEVGEIDGGMLETERYQGSSVTEDLRERCRTLAVELGVKEEELEDSRRKRDAAEVQFETPVLTVRRASHSTNLVGGTTTYPRIAGRSERTTSSSPCILQGRYPQQTFSRSSPRRYIGTNRSFQYGA